MLFDSRKRPPPTFVSLPAYMSALAPWVKLSLSRRLTVGVTVVESEFMQQDGNTPVCDKRDRPITCVFCCDL